MPFPSRNDIPNPDRRAAQGGRAADQICSLFVTLDLPAPAEAGGSRAHAAPIPCRREARRRQGRARPPPRGRSLVRAVPGDVDLRRPGISAPVARRVTGALAAMRVAWSGGRRSAPVPPWRRARSSAGNVTTSLRADTESRSRSTARHCAAVGNRPISGKYDGAGASRQTADIPAANTLSATCARRSSFPSREGERGVRLLSEQSWNKLDL